MISRIATSKVPFPLKTLVQANLFQKCHPAPFMFEAADSPCRRDTTRQSSEAVLHLIRQNVGQINLFRVFVVVMEIMFMMS